MNVIITGASGFVGRSLAARLAREPIASDQHLILVDHIFAPCPPGAEAIVGDIGDLALLSELAERQPNLVFHLSAAPGGASEADPLLSRRMNLDATIAIIEVLADAVQRPRFIYASSIAVFGVPLPAYVDDDTVAVPTITYGTHKLMIEIAIADAVRRGDLDALALRLPGIVARPATPSGLKSAFMSDLFHRLREGRPVTVPVSAEGNVWITSLARCIDNLVLVAAADWSGPTMRTAITMPALHVRMGDLAATIADQTGADHDLIRFVPDAELESQFAAYPPLTTLAAEAIGLRADVDVATLVMRTLSALEHP